VSQLGAKEGQGTPDQNSSEGQQDRGQRYCRLTAKMAVDKMPRCKHLEMQAS
jgi:hypothetical protein